MNYFSIIMCFLYKFVYFHREKEKKRIRSDSNKYGTTLRINATFEEI